MCNIRILLILTILLLSGCGVKSKLDKSCSSLKIEKVEIIQSPNANVNGRIIDKYDKFYLPSAPIKLKSLENEYSEISNTIGEFHFKNVASGKYEITSFYTGYCSIKDSIEFKSGETVKIKIELGNACR